jgi:glycosyltransferase involved in cell wall biosynthesis
MSVDVSVIVPTFNRRVTLERLLSTLLAQTLAPHRYEILVVSDGSTDGTRELMESLCAMHPNLRLLEQPNRGPAAARNLGARSAHGGFLAFTDDDCIASPDWLERMLEAFARTGAAGVQGRTTTDRGLRTPLTHQMEVLELSQAVPTCNAGYRKSVFEQVGGFDEGFPYPHNEDADLAWRVQTVGPVVFDAGVVMHHPPRHERFLQRARWVRCLESEFRLQQKHPVVYRRTRRGSPWKVIYWDVAVRNQARSLCHAVRYLRRPSRPQYVLLTVVLTAIRSCTLLFNLPRFWRASSRASTPVGF